MRRRHQQGSLKIRCGSWVAQWWDHGRRRNKVLGIVSETTKSEAKSKLAEIMARINGSRQAPSDQVKFENFVNQVYLPFYRRKWKSSTIACNEDRVKRHITSEFGELALGSFTRTGLQDFLDRKTAVGLSFSTVDHLRWDWKQILGMAVAEGNLYKNPAILLFTPRQTRRTSKPVMTRQDVMLLFSVLEPRELLICMLATIAGMRPGEIFGLQWRHVQADRIEVEQRVYRGQIDSPKTGPRSVALSNRLQVLFAQGRAFFGDPGPECWVFPSERLKTPLRKDNCWRRWIGPRLKSIGLGWVNFQVMRRTHASLMRELGVDPKTVADQLGHSVDVDLNVYSQTSIGVRRDAVNTLEKSTFVM
jgi:integrase